MTKQPSYRFEGYIESWEQRKLGEVGDFSIKTNSFSREKLSLNSGEIKNIHYGDILVKYNSTLDFENNSIPYVIDNDTKLTSDMFLKNGDIIFSDAAEDYSVGKCVELFNVSGNIVSGLHTIVCRPEIDFARYFLGYYLNSNSYRQQVLPMVQGAKVSSISKGNLSKTNISFPSLPEQTTIGSFFQDIDQLISLQQRKLEVLKEQKKTYLKLLFPAKGQKKPSLRFAGFEDEWQEVKLGEVFDIVTDYVANGSFESLRNNVRTYEKDNFAYMIRLQDASNSWKGPWLYTDEKGYNFLSKSRLFKDDILMSNVGTVGRFFQVPELDRPMTLAPNSVLIRSTSSNNQFLYFMMLTANIQDQITMRKTPGVQDKINKTDFKRVIATLPALPEQEAIGAFFQDLDKAIAKQEEKVNQLKESKQTLLRKMFI